MDESIDIHFPEFARHPLAKYEREKCAVFSEDGYDAFTLLIRYEGVRAAAIDWRTYTSAIVGVTAIPVVTHRDRPQLPIELDPPLHSACRPGASASQNATPLIASAVVSKPAPKNTVRWE